MRRFIMFFLVLLLCATSHFAFADTGEDKYELVTPEVRATAQHRVISGESLWGIYKKYYGDNPSVNKCRRLSGLNAIKSPDHIYKSQVIKIYKPLIMLQTSVGSNRTTVPLAKAVINAVSELKKSLQQADMKMSIPDGLVQKMVNGLLFSETIHRLNGEVVAVTTYGKSAQGWTKIMAGGELSGKSTIVRVDENYAVRATLAKQCENVSIQILKRVTPPPTSKVEISQPPPALPPPPPPKAAIPSPPPPFPTPPPPPMLYNRILQQFAEVLYRETVCPDCQADFSVGGQWQNYSDNSHDYTAWLYAAVRCQVWTDKDGNIHKPGIYINGSRWTGNWNDIVDFSGEIKTYGLEHRIQTPNNQEYIFRLGWYDRHQKESSSDIWGDYKSESKFTAIVFESEVDDTTRMNEQWLSRWKAGFGLIGALSSDRTSTWTSKLGQVVALAENPDKISGLTLKGEVSVWTDKKKLVTISGEGWAYLMVDGHWASKLTPFIGFLGDSIKIGYQFTEAYYGDRLSGVGPAWQLHLYRLYSYFRYKAWDDIPNSKNNIFTNPNAVLNTPTAVDGGDVFTDPGALL